MSIFDIFAIKREREQIPDEASEKLSSSREHQWDHNKVIKTEIKEEPIDELNGTPVPAEVSSQSEAKRGRRSRKKYTQTRVQPSRRSKNASHAKKTSTGKRAVMDRSNATLLLEMLPETSGLIQVKQEEPSSNSSSYDPQSSQLFLNPRTGKMETAAEVRKRLRRNENEKALRQRNLAVESEKEREERLARRRAAKKRKRMRETEEERNRRHIYERKYGRKRYYTKLDYVRQQNRDKMRHRRANESEEHREERLEKRRMHRKMKAAAEGRKVGKRCTERERQERIAKKELKQRKRKPQHTKIKSECENRSTIKEEIES